MFPFDSLEIPNHPLRGFVLLLPAFQGDGTAYLLFPRPLLLREPLLHLLPGLLIPVADVWEGGMAQEDEVDSAPQREQVRLDVGAEVVRGQREAVGLHTTAVDDHCTVLSRVLALEVGELDVQVFVEEQVGGLDVAVEDAVGVDPGDCLGGLATPGQPLLEGERLARLEGVFGDGAVRGAFQVDSRVCRAFAPQDVLM